MGSYLEKKCSWEDLSKYEIFQKEFIEKFKTKIDWIHLKNSKNILIKQITNKYITYWKIHTNIYIYENTNKTKRYLFLKNIEYIKIDGSLVRIK